MKLTFSHLMSLFLKDRGFGFGFGFGFWHCIKLGFFIFFYHHCTTTTHITRTGVNVNDIISFPPVVEFHRICFFFFFFCYFWIFAIAL